MRTCYLLLISSRATSVKSSLCKSSITLQNESQYCRKNNNVPVVNPKNNPADAEVVNCPVVRGINLLKLKNWEQKYKERRVRAPINK
jgi:hypothetical protein